KTLLIVICVLAAASAIVFIANRPSEPASKDSRVGAPLVDLGSLEKTSKIRLSDQGKTIVLARQADASWQVASYYGFPADISKLSQFVDELQKAKVDRFVTANAERIARFEFKDAKITLLDDTGKELWSMTLGKYADGGGRLIRFGSDPKAYLSRLNTWLDPEAKNWTDASLGSFKPDDIAQVEISFPGASPVVAKRAKKEDIFAAENAPAGSALKLEKITGLLNTLSSLRFSDTSPADDPNAVEAAKSPRTVKLTRFDGRTTTIALGRKPEQKIIKAPEPNTKQGLHAEALAKVGPAAILGKTGTDVLGVAPSPNAAPTSSVKEGLSSGASANEEPAKALESSTETIPAGPVYVFVKDSDAKDPINALMLKRAFQVFEYSFTSLPQKPDELFQALQPATQAATK
ncbi:MAG: DUF4340 domain-containing protein, partial [Opitutaceae bacterium]